MMDTSFAPLKDAHKCRAKDPKVCRYHGSLLRMEDALKRGHFSDYEAAKQDFLHAQPDPQKPVNTITEKPVETPIVGDIESAEVSRAYAHFSIIEDHMHNGAAVGSIQEIIYYSSPQGQLELRRRLNSKYNKQYLEIQETIASYDEKDKPRFKFDEEKIASLVAQGEQDLKSLTADPASYLDDRSLETDAVRHYLVEESDKWMRTLSTEQQEAISWLTSNGFGMVQHAIGVKNDNAGSFLFKGIVDRDAIADKHYPDFDAGDKAVEEAQNRYSRAYLKTVRSAFKNAPTFKEPVTITRGTSLHEVRDLVGGSSSFTELMDKVERGEFNGSSINSNSRMKKIPLSSSVSPTRAVSFTNILWDEDDKGESREVIVVIKAKSSTSPVNVGAWGSVEFEVLTNPTSDYKITGGRRVRDDLFVLELEEER